MMDSSNKRSTELSKKVLDLDAGEDIAYAARIENLPQLKTNYRITGGLIGKQPRKCSEFWERNQN